MHGASGLREREPRCKTHTLWQLQWPNKEGYCFLSLITVHSTTLPCEHVRL